MALDPTKHADWEIAEDSEKRMRPITEIAKKMGIQVNGKFALRVR